MSKALRMIERLREGSVSSSQIDWEQLLRVNYCTLLKSNAVIVDVGGNLGSHTNCFVNDIQANKIFVFEPIPNMYNSLVSRFGDKENIEIYPNALSDINTKATFYVKENAPAESGLARKDVYSDGSNSNLLEIEVEVRKLDDFNFGRKVDFIKIDIEGAEINMLRGAKNLIAKDRPLISAEYGYIG